MKPQEHPDPVSDALASVLLIFAKRGRQLRLAKAQAAAARPAPLALASSLFRADASAPDANLSDPPCGIVGEVEGG